jgi:hypothetical protein
MMKRNLVLTFALLVVTAGCATPRPIADTHCHSDRVLLDSHFEGGQLGKCLVLDDGTFELTLFPEDAPPINTSPWYAFRASGQPGDDVKMRLSFEDGYARYWPKISLDGVQWRPLAEEQVTSTDDGASMELMLELKSAHVWVSAQELLTADYYRHWLNELAANPAITTRPIGKTDRGRPLYLAETQDHQEMVLMLGRQHPPEVTGAIAMRQFIRTTLADTDLGRQFRARYKLLIVPLVNPDGVAAGHWRHNTNGVDLNRDWGPFTQPETRAVRQLLDSLEASGKRVSLLLDFHSTGEDLFYTQLAVDELDPPGFTTRWLTASSARLPDHPFKHEASETSDQANSKNYFFSTYGIAAITYEVGDETPRDRIEYAAGVFAEEMMRAMLASGQ